MRVSLLSSGPSTSVNGSGEPSRTVAQAGVLRHRPSGMEPVFCSDLGGILYGLIVRTVLLRLTAGLAMLIDALFVSVHTIKSLEVPIPTSIPASFLLMFCGPPRAEAYW